MSGINIREIRDAIVDGKGSAIAPLGAHITNSSLGSSVTLTPPPNASRILFQVFSQNIRLVFVAPSDVFEPTASTGFQFLAGARIDLPIAANTVIKVIQETASASIQYQWVR